MSENEEIIFFEKLRNGIREAQIKMLERKAKLGEKVVIGDKNGMPIQISAEEALLRYKSNQ